MTTLPKLYTYDSEDRAREWTVEVEGDQYRFVTGLVDGALVESTWTKAKPKNVGRANETTGEQQALAEATSAWTKKKKTGYAETLEASGPMYFDPMLAWAYEPKRIAGEECVFVQPKLDGIRCIANRDGLWSRKGEPFIAVPHIWEELRPIFEENPDLILDGELYNHDLKHNFNKITSCVKKKKPTAEHFETNKIVQFHIYDCHWGTDAPFHERNLLIKGMFDIDAFVYLRQVDTRRVYLTSIHEIDDHYAEWLEMGYEGQIVRLDRAYQIGQRTYFLLKRKEFITEEFPILGFEEGTGNWSGAVKAIRSVTAEGKEFKASRDGDYEMNADLLSRAAEYANGTMTVRFLNWTPDGKPRGGIAIAVFTGERDD